MHGDDRGGIVAVPKSRPIGPSVPRMQPGWVSDDPPRADSRRIVEPHPLGRASWPRVDQLMEVVQHEPVQASQKPKPHRTGPLLHNECHFQKPTALADPRVRLDRARVQSGFDPAPVRKWAALFSFWIRTRLHQGSERPKPVTDPTSCGTSCGSGESGDSVPGTVTMSRSVDLCRTQET